MCTGCIYSWEQMYALQQGTCFCINIFVCKNKINKEQGITKYYFISSDSGFVHD